MPCSNIHLGKKGEERAVNYLRQSGYKILQKNYKTKLGEIDIIARDKGTLAFIEVKTRKTDRFGAPVYAVSPFKQRQISQAAILFLKRNKLFDRKARFDVVSILYSDKEEKIDLIKNAFELDGYFT